MLRSRDPSILIALWLASHLAWGAESGAEPAEPAEPVYAALGAGEVVRLEGSYRMRQGLDAATAIESELEVVLEVFVDPGASKDCRSLLVVQSISPGSKDGLFRESGVGVELATLSTPADASRGDTALRLASEPSGLGLPITLAGYVRIDSVLPLFSLPLSDGTKRVKSDVMLFGKPRHGRALTVRARRREQSLEVTRELDLPKEGLRFEGEDRTLSAWTETVRFQKRGPGRWTVVSLRRNVEFLLERQGFEYRVSRQLDLRATGQRALGDVEKASLRRAWPTLAELAREFDQAGKAATRKVYSRLAELKSALAAPVFARALAAIENRTRAHHSKPRPTLVGAAGRRLEIGKAAPDFILEDLAGDEVSLSSLTQGKVALLTFWGYGCGPCRVEAPYLTGLLGKYGDKGFTVVAVNAWAETRETVESFVRREKLKHKILMGGRGVAKSQYGVRVFPTAFWIDRQGNAVYREVGFRPSNVPAMERRIEELLADGEAKEGKRAAN